MPALGANGFTPLSAQVGGFNVTFKDLRSPGYFSATLSPPDPTRRFELVEHMSSQPMLFVMPGSDHRGDGFCHGYAFSPQMSVTNNYTFIWPRRKVIEVIVQPQAAAPKPFVWR